MMSGGGSGLAPPPYPGYASPSAASTPPGPAQASPGAFRGHHLAQQHPPHPTYSEAEEKQRLRFQVELEFVQCLGNPNYLHFLAQRGYFKDSAFINYLSYLQYWKEPKYVRFIKYPVCLHFLELLQHHSFRKEIVNGQCAKFLDDQTILHWQHYTRKRVKLIESSTSAVQQAAQGTSKLACPSVSGK